MPSLLTASSFRSEWWWLIGATVALAAAKVVRTAWVPEGAHLAFNLGLAALVVVAGAVVGLTASEWGLARSAAVSGLRWGGAVYLLIAVGAGLFALVAGSSSAFEYGRNDLTGAELAASVLVRIPLGTVITEELAFRGLLLALSCRLMPLRVAVVVNAVVFGMWHIVDAWDQRLLEVAGVVVATALAGVGFCWLRIRSGSLIAPAIAHAATNTIPLTVAWLATRP